MEKNPAPLGMPQKVLILILKKTTVHPKVVQDFFHQQYFAASYMISESQPSNTVNIISP